MYEFKCDQEALKKAIEIAGGMQPLAKKIGVSYQAILNWKSERTKMNPIRCVKIEEATEGIVKRSDILPDYPWEKFK
jgi:DNA-binding transcriptional regulator YdaS (Cro superfamily)